MDAAGRSVLRWVLYAVAALVIGMALVVGTLRLLLPLAPEYQDDIRAWASAATGYDIRFDGISASWPLSGPQLSFYDVSLTRPGEAGPVLTASEFSAGLSLWQLLRDRRLALGRVSVSGSRLAVERTADGGFLVEGRRLQDLLPERDEQRLPEIDIVVADVAVTYLDKARDPKPVAFLLERLDAALSPERVGASAEIGLPARLGRRVDVEIDVPGALPRPPTMPRDWTLRVRGQDLQLAPLWRYVLGEPGPLRSAVGMAGAELRFADARLQRLDGEVALADVAVGMQAAPSRFERLAAKFTWQRTADGWMAALSDLRAPRRGRPAPASAVTVSFVASTEASAERWTVAAPFVRLDDLYPLAQAALAGTQVEAELPRSLAGDVRSLEAEVANSAEEPERYAVRADFDRLGVTSASGEIAVSGLAGSVAADGDGGRLQLAGRNARLQLAQWFREPLDARSLTGLLVWRSGPEGWRFVSDDVQLASDSIDIRSRIELLVPHGDASPSIDLKATASATAAREVLRHLPLRRFPPRVVEWLERAVVAGRVPRAEVEFRGPVRDFPFEPGEGVFRAAVGLEDATLDYANGWPRVEDLDGEVVFEGVGMYSMQNSARIGRLAVRDFQVRIPDLRRGVLAIAGRERMDVAGLLGFVRATPVAPRLGASLQRIEGGGPVDTALRLALPIARLKDFDLQLLFDLRGARLGWKALPLDLRDIRGRVRLRNTRFDADGVQAVMLGAPVTVDVGAEPGNDGLLTHLARLRGTTPIGRVAATFKLPRRRFLEGSMAWEATVTLPPQRPGRQAPVLIGVRSDLRGVGSSLPPPLAKPAASAWPIDVELALLGEDAIELTGTLAMPAAWALRLTPARGDGWIVERGTVNAGATQARVPERRGLVLEGRVEELPLADWLGLEDDGDGAGAGWREIRLDIGRLVFAGEVFRDVGADVRRGATAWEVRLTGPRTEGTVTVPFDTARQPLMLDMDRLWLVEAAPGDGGPRPDPRELPAIRARIRDAALGDWRFGSLEMDVDRIAEGLEARRIVTAAPGFSMEGKAAWRVEGGDAKRQSTRLEATLKSTDFRRTLEQLGFDPVISGESARITASLAWPDAPNPGFLAQAEGRIAVDIRDGQVLDIEPGSGRLLGLLSVTALPRRLSLDFSDVFKKGLAFDGVSGQFRVGAGNAFTCNLGLTGPAADIGIVGRTGFAARDYDQFAVVRPQVSNVLAVGGAVLGGPVGGVTMLLISQLFRKPLSTLGESYYRVSGAWDEPAVVRVDRADLDASAFKDCEREVEAALRVPPQGAAPQPGAQPAPAAVPGTTDGRP